MPRIPFYISQGLKFACTQCGACCIGGANYHVFLNGDEADKVRRHLGLTPAWFRRRYIRRLASGEQVTALAADGRCTFLDADGRCRVYPVRPLQCRTYPFWPELVNSRAAWLGEARRCEGINRGEPVPVKKIRQHLKRHE